MAWSHACSMLRTIHSASLNTNALAACLGAHGVSTSCHCSRGRVDGGLRIALPWGQK